MQINTILNLVLKDYLKTQKEKWTYIIGSSIFFVVFLLLYKPFGLSDSFLSIDTTIFEKLSFVLVEGINVFTVLSLSLFFFRKYLKKNKNSIKNLIIIFSIEVLLIVIIPATPILINELFIEGPFIHEHTFIEGVFGLLFLYAAHFLILLYPALASILFIHLKQLHLNNEVLKKEISLVNVRYKMIANNDDLIKICDENNKHKITIDLSSLYSIESKNQYVVIKFKRDNQIIERTIRTRFSKLLFELDSFPSILRCHRSFAINLQNVASLSSINNSPTLILGKDFLIKIPISKSYFKDIKEKLTQI